MAYTLHHWDRGSPLQTCCCGLISSIMQEEELEVLRSIYDGDECFKEISPTSFQYRVGSVGHAKSFLIDLEWPPDYPHCSPSISLDGFFNRHLPSSTKAGIVKALTEQCEAMLDTPMTYSLLEFAKESAEDIVTLPDQAETECLANTTKAATQPPPKRKEVLTKQAKRKLAGRTNAQGELPRGWNWVDVIKHLSRTGPQQDN